MIISSSPNQKLAKLKKHASQQKDNDNNLNIFKRLIESQRFSSLKNPTNVNLESDSYVYSSFIKMNNFAEVNNSTLLFDDAKEIDVMLNISNFDDGEDFLENSNFKNEFLTSEIRFIGVNTEIVLEGLENNTRSVELENKDNLIVSGDGRFFNRHRCKIIVFFTLSLSIIIIIIVNIVGRFL